MNILDKNNIYKKEEDNEAFNIFDTSVVSKNGNDFNKINELDEKEYINNESIENDKNINTELSFDIKNVLTYAYLPLCLKKMKEGEYMYKWNNNNIFQKKSLKFFYLDVQNYCIRWNTKKKKIKENKNPCLYISDIIQILDGYESLFFKRKESEKNLSIEIISTNRSLRLTFLDMQRWKMWLFGLLYYQYKLVNQNGKKIKTSIYETNNIYDTFIISGLKDINALTLSQLYIILRSLNIYLNMKILYHYFSIYKNKGIIDYNGFTKILEHIFCNMHISSYFNMYKDKKNNYMDKTKFIEFLIDIQSEGKMLQNNLYEQIKKNEEIEKMDIKENEMVNKKGLNNSLFLNNNKQIKRKQIKEQDSQIKLKLYKSKDDTKININKLESKNSELIKKKKSSNNSNYAKSFFCKNDVITTDEDYLLIMNILKKKLKNDKNVNENDETKDELNNNIEYRAKLIYEIFYCTKKYNIPFVINESRQLTEIGLIYFLVSKENNIMNPLYLKVYQDMDLPLCNYWINSSHNSYLSRKQIFSTSNLEQYIYILLEGCRCVEFDCYYINKNIVLYHGFYGYKLTSSILFCDALIACKIFGFTYSPYPIILSLEIHCKNKHKNLIAKILISILGTQLYIPKTSDEINNITPFKCQNKFLVKYKRFKNKNDDSSIFYDIFQGLQNILYDELDYLSDILECNEECNVEIDDESENGEESDENKMDYIDKIDNLKIKNTYQNSTEEDNLLTENSYESRAKRKNDENNKQDKIINKKQNHEYNDENEDNNNIYDTNKEKKKFYNFFNKKKSSNMNDLNTSSLIKKKKTKLQNEVYGSLLNEYSCLKGYVFQNFYENRTNNEICSISENKFIKLIKKDEKQIIKYNQKTLTRVYPSGTRLSSTNFNPLIFWNAGIQVVALNYQYNGLSMLLNKGKFLENGGKYSGYILKPELLRFNQNEKSVTLTLNILSLYQMNLLFSIKNRYHEVKLKKKLFKMNMMEKIATHKIKKKNNNINLHKIKKENIFFSDIQSEDNKNITYEKLIQQITQEKEVNYINKKIDNIEQKYEEMLSEYKSFLLCSTFSHSNSFNSCSSNTTTSNNNEEKMNCDLKHNCNVNKNINKVNELKRKNKSFYQTFEELKKANNIFFYLYVTISIHGYNENKYYFKTEIAKVNFYDLNYCWKKPSNFEMKINYPSLALIVFELKAYDTVKSEIIACACFPIKCLREGLRFVPLCDKYLNDIKGSGILVNLKINSTDN